MLPWLLILTLTSVVWGHTKKVHDDRIVGGVESDISKRPYQVSVRIENGTHYFVCGGSIINTKKILTAAHCLDKNVTKITIRAGSNYTTKGGQTSTTLQYTMHEKYNRITQDYDVAIVHIDSKPLKLNGKTVKASKLAQTGTTTPDGNSVTVSGWGDTSEGGEDSEVLREVTLKKVSTAKCKETYPELTSRMLCAGVPGGGKDSCQGDSGGPLVTRDLTQIGVVSYGQGCARPNTPGVYADVAKLRTWIKTHSGT